MHSPVRSHPVRRVVTVLVSIVVGLGGAALSTAAVAQANPTISGSTTGANGTIWVPNYGTGSVLEINPKTMRPIRSIPNTGSHPMVIKMSHDRSKLFVGNFGPFDWSVTVIEAKTGRVITKMPTIGAAYAVIQMSADGKRLYVPTAFNVVQVIDTSTLKLIRVIPIVLPPGVSHIEVSPDEKYVYSYAAPGTITRYDAYTGLPVGVPLYLEGVVPGWGMQSVDGSTLYAVNFWNGVAIIDAKKWRIRTVSQISPFGAGPISGTLTPDGKQIWVCNYQSDDIRVLDAETGEQLKVFKTTGVAPVYVGFSDDGKTGYLTTLDDGIPLPVPAPWLSTGIYYTKDEAYWADLLGLNAHLTKIDTRTFTKLGKYTERGAFVAGVFPGST